MTMQEIAQMHFHSVGMSWDKLPARDASIKDIDLEKVKRYIRTDVPCHKFPNLLK
jgi:predicted HTH transcriptional regulator